jgi:YVTN family beta-propeller protein
MRVRQAFIVSELPSGTVTFLFTDIEGSTALIKRLGGRYSEVLAEHQRILREAFAAHHGHEVDTQGDSFFAAFPRAKDAVAAAVDAQRDLSAHSWPEGEAVLVRMGLHTGEPQVGEQRYVGIGVHKAARIGAAGHGGQVLLSSTTRELIEDELPAGVTTRDLGERRLKDLERPERLFQLEIEGLRSDFAPLKTLDVELKRKRRRLYAGAALIGVLAAAVAIPVFALGQGSGGGSANIAPNSVAIIDPGSNKVSGLVPVGVRPSAVAIGEGAVWVANLDDRTMSRIDPISHTVVANVPLQATPTGLAVGYGSVWIANGLLGTVSRFDPGVNAVSATIPEVAPRSSSGSVDASGSAVWFASGIGTFARIDPSQDKVTGNGVAGNSPSGIAASGGFIWIANQGSNKVSQADPRTMGVVGQISAGQRPSGIAVGDDAVWVTNEGDDTVTRIDISSGSTRTIPVGRGPTGIAFGAGAVWVANSGDGTVSRIDPTTYDVAAKIEVGSRPSGVAVGSGSVWVTVQAPLQTVG